MGSVGKAFPPEFLNDYIARHTSPGEILHLKFDQIDHPKYAVLVCSDPQLFLLINSRISPYVCARPYLASHQLKITTVDYDFLDHDSYIDCSRVARCSGEASAQLLGRLTRANGTVNDATR